MKNKMDNLYHIYVKNECVYHSLPKEEFDKLWDFVQKLTWLTDIDPNDIQYEEVVVNKQLISNSSY